MKMLLFSSDVFGVLFIFPFTRKLLLSKFSKNYPNKKNLKEKNYIDGEFEDIDDKDGK